MLLALPFSAKVVQPPVGSQSPALHALQYSLPLAVGKLFDATVLSSDARPLADEWCRRVVGYLRAAGRIVTPLRTAAEERLEGARAAARAAVQAARTSSGTSESGSRRKPQAAAAQDTSRSDAIAHRSSSRGRAHVAAVKQPTTARYTHPAPSA